MSDDKNSKKTGYTGSNPILIPAMDDNKDENFTAIRSARDNSLENSASSSSLIPRNLNSSEFQSVDGTLDNDKVSLDSTITN